MKKQIKITELIEEEYTTHNDWENDEVYWLKEALLNALNPLERKIYITYLENGTYAAVAKMFKVTTPTVSRYINNLKTKIIDYVDNHFKSDTD